MTIISKLNSLLVASSLFAATATASLADTASWVITGFQPQPLVVESDGQNYTTLKNLGIVSIQAHVTYDAGEIGRILSWYVSPVVRNDYGPATMVPYIADYKVSKTYAVGDRPKTMDKYPVMQIPASKFAAPAIGMCNLLADTLRSEGKTDAQIFSTDREVAFDVGLVFEVEASGPDTNVPGQISPVFNAKVICKKRPPATNQPAAGELANTFAVNQVNLGLQEVATKGGACMAKLQAYMYANAANQEITYRFLHSSGKKSKVYSIKTKYNKTAVAKRQWEIPNKSGKEIGWFWVEGVNVKFKSAPKGYNMDCKAKSPGGLTAGPSKPKVRLPVGGTGLKAN